MNVTLGTHRAIIENFVLPHIRGHRKNLILVVDDSVFVAGNLQWVEEYNARYREVMAKLNLAVRLLAQPCTLSDPDTTLPRSKNTILN